MKGSGKLDGVEIELYHVDEWNWKIGWSWNWTIPCQFHSSPVSPSHLPGPARLASVLYAITHTSLSEGVTDEKKRKCHKLQPTRILVCVTRTSPLPSQRVCRLKDAPTGDHSPVGGPRVRRIGQTETSHDAIARPTKHIFASSKINGYKQKTRNPPQPLRRSLGGRHGRCHTLPTPSSSLNSPSPAAAGARRRRSGRRQGRRWLGPSPLPSSSIFPLSRCSCGGSRLGGGGRRPDLRPSTPDPMS
jgi:hypothetical protein